MERFFIAVRQGNTRKVTRLLDADPGRLEKANDKGTRPLALAASRGHLGLVRLMLQRGASANAAGRMGKTALHWAAFKGQEGVVMFLLRHGAHANRRNDVGRTPLMLACGKGDVGVVRVLLQYIGIHGLQETDNKGRTALHWAASGGHAELVAFLLKDGAQVNRKAYDGATPFITACQKGRLGVVRMLLQHIGTQGLQETDNQGRTALHWAANRGHEAVATFLLEQGAQANGSDALGETPFILACKKGHLAVVRLLLRHVGEQALHQRDDDGRTALHWAASWGHGEEVAFLLGQGAEANSRDIFGRTPLLYGCEKGHLGVVRVLARHMGGDGLKERYAGAKTVLHWAAFRGHEEVVALLIGMGAQANSRDAFSKTPLMLACEKGHIGVVRMLPQHTGKEGLKEKDANGRTVLHWVVEKGYHEAVKILLLAGADPTITDNEGRTPRALAEGEVERAGCVAAFEVRESRVLYPHSDISLSVLTSGLPTRG
jgi:ankyrin repeat protein